MHMHVSPEEKKKMTHARTSLGLLVWWFLRHGSSGSNRVGSRVWREQPHRIRSSTLCQRGLVVSPWDCRGMGPVMYGLVTCVHSHFILFVNRRREFRD